VCVYVYVRVCACVCVYMHTYVYAYFLASLERLAAQHLATGLPEARGRCFYSRVVTTTTTTTSTSTTINTAFLKINFEVLFAGSLDASY